MSGMTRKKAPSIGPWELPKFIMADGANGLIGRNFNITKIRSVIYQWKDNVMLIHICIETMV